MNIARLQIAVIKPWAAAATSARVTWIAISRACFRLEWTLSPNEGFQRFRLDQFHRVNSSDRFPAKHRTEIYRPHFGCFNAAAARALAQETFPYHLRVTSRGRGLDYFQRHGAVQHFICRAISHTHRAANQFPERTVFAPRDLEIAED